ncbi:MAG: sulfatase-like hydrolase/transferase [Planctomycetota bacterium]
MRERPDFVLTMADDQRRTAWCDGGEPVATPNLSTLARRGRTFTRAQHPGSPVPAVCVAARAMLHTGQGPHLDATQISAPGGVLLAERLRAAGYVTLFAGKWHNGRDALLRSFDAGEAVFLGGMADPFETPFSKLSDGELTPVYAKGVHATDAIAEGAAALIRRHARGALGDRPMALFVAFTAPHDPRATHHQWHDRYPHANVELPPNMMPVHPFDNGELYVRDELLTPRPRDPGQTRREIADYYAMVEHLDHGIGRVHAALAEHDLFESALLAHTADHGLAVGQHGLMGKQNLYEHSVGVPLILAGPGVKSGTDDRLCYNADLHPTLLSAAGIEPDAGHFQSLLGEPDDDRQLQCYYRDVQRSVTLSDGRKLIEYTVDDTVRRVAFDLSVDPFELDASEPDEDLAALL